jgi:hypothetical protein
MKVIDVDFFRVGISAETQNSATDNNSPTLPESCRHNPCLSLNFEDLTLVDPGLNAWNTIQKANSRLTTKGIITFCAEEYKKLAGSGIGRLFLRPADIESGWYVNDN